MRVDYKDEVNVRMFYCEKRPLFRSKTEKAISEVRKILGTLEGNIIDH